MFAKLLAGIYGKLAGLALILLLFLGLFMWGHHVGAAAVQAKWDLATAQQTQLALKSSESARATEHTQAQAFAGIESTYLQISSHVYPSIADSLPAAVAAGTVRLRNACPAAGSSDVPSTATRARELDAAATQALADRTQAAIFAVSAGDAADKREADFRALIVSLRALLSAERNDK